MFEYVQMFVILGVILPNAVQNLVLWAYVTGLNKLAELVYIKTSF